MPHPAIETRLARLEELLAHQDRMSQDLSDLVAQQSAEIDRLTRQFAALIAREQTRDSDQGGGIFIGAEKPPHW